MTPEKRELLKKIAGSAEVWRRRCNGQPQEGILMSRRQLLAILSISNAVATGAGGLITWRADGRVFTAEPVRDEAATPGPTTA